MKEEIRAVINEALKTLGVEGVNFVVDFPTDKNSGADFYSNVAMVISKQLGKSPVEVAAIIENSFWMQAVKAEATGPFLNFFLDKEWYTNQLKNILAGEEGWGRGESQKGEVVLVEYTSPNLFKPLHIGNLVGNIVGESLTRLFEYQGAVVKRLNYPSDIGLTVAKAVWGLKQTNGDPTNIDHLGEAYRFGNEAYETNEESKSEIEIVNQALYADSDPSLSLLRDQGILTSKLRLNTICASLGTKFDREILESQAAPKGTEIVKENISKVFKESDGAVVYQGERVGLHTRVFLNSKGLPTYEAKDLGNFSIKQEIYPNWTRSLIVTGNEQTEYFKVLYAAIRELYPDIDAAHKTLEHVSTGFLTLTTGKMSSRKGNVLSGEQLLEELEQEAVNYGSSMEREYENDTPLATKVASAAIKYQILRQSVGSNIVFDKERALSFEGDSGPYLQYTYARIQSVLEKAAQLGVEANTDYSPDNPYEVQKLLSRFPAVTETALWERSPHKLVTYLTELAGAFNSFYAHEKIADTSNISLAKYKVAVSKAVAITLRNGLDVLGIEAPERM